MRKIKLGLLSLLIIFIGVINVNAANQTTGAIQRSDSRFRFYGNEIVNAEFGDPNAMFYKFAGGNSYVCISGVSVEVKVNESCTINNDDIFVSPKKRIGAAYIIETMTGSKGGIADMGSMNAKYYWLEIVILKYLGKDAGITFTPEEINTQISSVSGKQGLTYSKLESDADAYATKYSKDIDIRLELENNAKEIVFTEKEDSYLSQKIYLKDVNGNADKIEASITDNPDAKIVEGSDLVGKFYQIKINKDKVQGQKLSATLKVNASNEYYVASFYDCTKVEGQNLMSTATDKLTKTDSVTIKAEIKSTKLTIYKKDANGNYLEGVKLKIESKDNGYSKEVLTGNEPLVLTDLEYGTYTITEISAPNGYSILKEPKTVVLSETKLSEEVTLVNNLNKVEIRKISAIDGSLLEGATLQIQTEDGEVIDEWKTTKEAYVIEGLENGTYYLVEISAPKGFELNKEKIKFVIDDKTNIEYVVMVNELEVEVPNTLSSRSALLVVIAMFDIALGIGILSYVKNRKNEE